MKKTYDAPELELLELKLSRDVLGVSVPEETQAHAGGNEGPGTGGGGGLIGGDF